MDKIQNKSTNDNKSNQRRKLNNTWISCIQKSFHIQTKLVDTEVRRYSNVMRRKIPIEHFYQLVATIKITKSCTMMRLESKALLEVEQCTKTNLKMPKILFPSYLYSIHHNIHLEAVTSSAMLQYKYKWHVIFLK